MDEHTQPVFDNGETWEQLPEQPADGLSAPRRRLGRGISSLLGGLADGPAIVDENPRVDAGTGEFLSIDEGSIARNPYQPRKEFDEAALAEMVESIAPSCLWPRRSMIAGRCLPFEVEQLERER